MSQSVANPTSPMQARLFDFPVDLVTIPQGLERIQVGLDAGETRHVVTLNPEMIMRAERDADLSRILKRAELVIPDGAGVVWALRTYGYQAERLPGIEFSEALLQQAAEHSYRVAVIGAREEVLVQALESLKGRLPGLNLVYTHHGFFRDEAQVARDCAAQRPQLVLVALGVPRQEKWIDQHRAFFEGAVLVGIGGSLDVWSGTSKRAPAWMRRVNLEWLYRISSEPWRIKRIYKTLPMFVVKVLMSPRPS